LVNNAGILNMAAVEETSLELWNRIVSVNQTGVWLGMNYTVPALRAAGGGVDRQRVVDLRPDRQRRSRGLFGDQGGGYEFPSAPKQFADREPSKRRNNA
jgi:NAD(P)-dependent dehydrogenase (short-subunit alcohol dehydrogenase family)